MESTHLLRWSNKGWPNMELCLKKYGTIKEKIWNHPLTQAVKYGVNQLEKEVKYGINRSTKGVEYEICHARAQSQP